MMIRGTSDLVDYLAEARLFSGWSHDDLNRIAPSFVAHPLDPGETLFPEGAPGDAMFVILEGRLAAFRGDQEVGDLLEGDHLGEGALVDGGPRRAGVRGADPATIAVLSREAFDRLGEEAPHLHARLLAAILRELKFKMSEAEGFLDTR
jgi:CRP-like cAMP-binding protein